MAPCKDCRWMIFQSCFLMGPDWYLACLLPICQRQIPRVLVCALAECFSLDLQQLPCVITPRLRVHNEVLSDSWLRPNADKLKKALLSKLYNTWPKGDEFTDWRLGRNPGFWQCQCSVFACVFGFHGLSYTSVPALPRLDPSLCLHVQLHLSGYSAPHLLVVIPLVGGHRMPLM